MKKQLGEMIRELRNKAEISLRGLAREVQVSAPFLCDVELGRRNPSEGTLRRIAEQLGVSFERLKSLRDDAKAQKPS